MIVGNLLSSGVYIKSIGSIDFSPTETLTSVSLSIAVSLLSGTAVTLILLIISSLITSLFSFNNSARPFEISPVGLSSKAFNSIPVESKGDS